MNSRSPNTVGRSIGPTATNFGGLGIPYARALAGAFAALLAVLILAAPASAATPAEAIAFLNQQRVANGIPGDLVEDPSLGQGCTIENHHVASAGPPPSATSSPWDDAPAHQWWIYRPEATQAGYTESSPGQYPICMRFGGFQDRGGYFLYTSPTGRRNVPVSVSAREIPATPGEHVGIPQGTETGPNLIFYGPGLGRASDPSLTTASLTGPEGAVEVRLAPLDRGYPPTVVIPVRPLRPGATYQVSATWTTGYVQTDAFTTAADSSGDSGPKSKSSRPRVKRKGRALTLTVDPAAVGQKARLTITKFKVRCIVNVGCPDKRTYRKRRSLKLRASQKVSLPRVRRGERIRVELSIPAFTVGAQRYRASGVQRVYR